jgi:uncharacterized surface protein with fasciclin (FAS1) repeats
MRTTVLLLALALAGCGGSSDSTESTSTSGSSGSSSGSEATRSDIVDTAVAAGSFGTLVAAVQAAGLEETLRGAGPFTVFAPTDAAFAALPAGTLDSLLLPENRAQLTSILTYHVVSGRVMAADAAGLSEAPTVNGASAPIAPGASGGLTIGGANIVTTDIECSNGVIHVIDAVILPPS